MKYKFDKYHISEVQQTQKEYLGEYTISEPQPDHVQH